jgi:hypothetical protein
LPVLVTFWVLQKKEHAHNIIISTKQIEKKSGDDLYNRGMGGKTKEGEQNSGTKEDVNEVDVVVVDFSHAFTQNPSQPQH